MRTSQVRSERSSDTAASGFYGPSPAFNATSAAIGINAPAVSPFLPVTDASLEPASGDASDGIDHAFFFWILAGLVAAALACGAVAMSALMPASG